MLTALQQYTLAAQISADPELSRRFYLGGDGMRILEFNAQRSLHEASDKFFRQRFGQSAEEIVATLNAEHDRAVLAQAAKKKISE